MCAEGTVKVRFRGLKGSLMMSFCVTQSLAREVNAEYAGEDKINW